jgi:hypothetical protein
MGAPGSSIQTMSFLTRKLDDEDEEYDDNVSSCGY